MKVLDRGLLFYPGEGVPFFGSIPIPSEHEVAIAKECWDRCSSKKDFSRELRKAMHEDQEGYLRQLGYQEDEKRPPISFPPKFEAEESRLLRRQVELRLELKESMRPKEVECGRCGQCCERFTLPWCWDKILRNREAWLNGEERFEGKPEWSSGWTRTHPEMAQWSYALTPLDSDEARRGLIVETIHEGDQQGIHWYGCRFLTRENGVAHCYIHKTRWYTCRAFLPKPMGGYLWTKDQIPYPGCTFRELYDWEQMERWENFDVTLDSVVRRRAVQRECVKQGDSLIINF